jgi:glycosyltransferase involved in cell wall biosynthesis
MKILMLLESEFPPDVRVENEITALVEAGHKIHLACSTRKNRFETETLGKAIIHRRPMSTFIYKSSVGCLKFPFYFNFWRTFVFDLLKKEKFDAIHIHDLPLSTIGAEAKKKFNLSLVIDLHENWPALLKYAPHTHTFMGRLLSSDKQWTEYEKTMLPEADLIVTIVEEARDRVALLGIDKSRICIVSNTANIENIPELILKERNNDFTVFYGGGLNRHRGLQVVFEAIRLLKEKNININLNIVGSGSYRKDLEAKAATLHIESNVRFFGQKPFDEMMGLLADTDAAIIPHLRTENNDASSPNKLYQYMYMKKPVISSDCISLKRIIGETDSGFIYRNDSPEELASLLEKLKGKPALLKEKGINGRKAVLSEYNWDFDKKRLVMAYKKLWNTSAISSGNHE